VNDSAPPGETIRDTEVPVAGFKPKRGRPSAAQVVAIDAAILQSATALFLENGYANTAMEAVAASVGVSKGTLYARYRGKADLFHAIATDRLARWSRHLPDTIALPPADLSEELFRSGIGFLRGLRMPEVAAFDRLINNEAMRFPELSRQFHQQGYVPFIDQLAHRLTASAAGWPIADAASVAAGFIAALLGWFRMTRLLRDPTEADVAAFVARQVAIIVGGRAAW
jgi:AcrR family transcriptional regulator